MSVKHPADPDKRGRHPSKEDPREQGEVPEKEMTAKIIKKIPGTRSPESVRTAARKGGGLKIDWRQTAAERLAGADMAFAIAAPISAQAVIP
jgi:hypothetical protein